MMAEVEPLFTALEERRFALLRRLALYSDQQLCARPSPRSWSLLGVAEHVMLAERVTLRVIGRQEAAGRLTRRWYHRPLAGLVAHVLESSLRVPMTGRVLVPSETATLGAVASEWKAVRAGWRSYLEGITAEGRQALVVRHPIAGPMTVAEALVFLRGHLDHHGHQIARLERWVAGSG